MRRLLPLALAVVGCSSPLVHAPDGTQVPSAPPSALFDDERVTDRIPTPKGDLVVVPLEHASILLGWDGKAIYVDPTSPAIDDSSLPRADVVLLTDVHYDHLDPVVVARLRQPGTVVVGPPDAAERTRLDVVTSDGAVHDVLGVGVTAVPIYDAARGPVPGVAYHDRGRANGYVLDLAGVRVYVSGDAECTPELRALGHVDVAFVGMNVPYAMGPHEAAQCVTALHPRIVFPYDYRHADLSRFDPSLFAPGTEIRRRDFYPRARELRQQAYDAFVRGLWGLADDKLDDAERIDPEGEKDWRVVMTRRWLRECERPFPW